MRGKTLLLALAVVVIACSPAAQSGVSPTPQVQATPGPSATVTPPTASVPTSTSAPTTTSDPSATPVARTIRGQTRVGTGAVPVAGVRIRAMPMSLGDGRSPGPEVVAVSDADGAYSLTVMVWTPEALAASSSFQLMFDIVAPPGLLVVGVTTSIGSPPGTASTGPFMIDSSGRPIDVTLARGLVIAGKVSGPTGVPLEAIQVAALGPGSIIINGGAGDAFEVQATGSTDATGRYRLTVPSGVYVIHTRGPQGIRFWTDDPAVFQPTPLKVEQDLEGIDIALVPVTTIGGQVRTGPSYVEGLAGVRVVAYVGGGSACCRIVGVATTGYVGTFLMHLPPGRYRIAFEPPAGSPYVMHWWSGAAAFATATDLTLGQAQVQLEAELARSRP